MTITLIGRGRALFVNDNGNVVPFLTYAQRFAVEGVEFECNQQRRRGSNSFSVGIESSTWGKTTPLQRQLSMTALAQALHDGGVSSDEARYVDSRPNRDGQGFKNACNIYIDLDQATASASAPKMDADAQVASLTTKFLAAGGDVKDIPNLPSAVLVGWFNSQLTDAEPEAPTTGTSQAELENEDAPL